LQLLLTLLTLLKTPQKDLVSSEYVLIFLSYLLGLCPYLSQGAHERLQIKSYVLFIWTLSCSPEIRNLASTILLGLNLVSGQCSSLVIRVTSVEHLVI
jgi:hypothetical protein